MAGKLELAWREDARSIDILEDIDDVHKYKPLIMLNFELLVYDLIKHINKSSHVSI